MKNRTTPENIVELKDNEVFVFGSNLSGRHGKGAAKTAMKWGARWGKGAGLAGKTYAIPTKDEDVRFTLSIEEIKPHVDAFIQWAEYRTDDIFFVTAVGTGLAGIAVEDIAPLFKKAVDIPNIFLPKSFWEVLHI